MSKFTLRELKRCMVFGAALLAMGLILWLWSRYSATGEDIPEYGDFARMLGYNLLAIGALWVIIAGSLSLPRHSSRVDAVRR